MFALGKEIISGDHLGMEMQLGGQYVFAPLYFVIKLSPMDGCWSLRCLYDYIKLYFFMLV